MMTIYGSEFKPITRFATDTSDLADLAVNQTSSITRLYVTYAQLPKRCYVAPSGINTLYLAESQHVL